MKNLLALILLIIVLPVYGLSPSFADDSFSGTDTDILMSRFINPALLAFDRDIRISYLLEYDEEQLGKGMALAATFYGFGMKLDIGDVSSISFRRFSLGKGLFISAAGVYFGFHYSWYYSPDPQIDQLESLTLGFSKFFNDHLLFSFSVRDIIMSPTGAGLIKPEYSFGLGLQLFEGDISLHANLSLYEGLGVDQAEKSFSLTVAPVQGLKLGFQYTLDKKEDYVGVSLGFSLDHFSISSQIWGRNNKLTKSYAALSMRRLPQPSLAGRGYRSLLVDLAGDFSEDAKRQYQLIGSTLKPTFLDLLTSLRKAAMDPSIKVVYLRVLNHRLSYARSEELLYALRLCKKAGKIIIAYLESGSSRAYAIASIADKLYLQPSSNLSLKGVGAVVTFIKGFLDRVGLKADLLYIGKYKSAAQLATLDSLSEAHREAEQRLLKVFHSFLIRTIAAHRTSGDRVKAKNWLNKGLVLATEALAQKMVDGLKYESEVQHYVNRMGLRAVRAFSYLKEKKVTGSWTKKPVLAVIHVTGSIVNGSGISSNPLLGGQNIGADTIVGVLRNVAANPRIKAIIVRVQSGGGDLVGSDKMWKAVNNARKRKPLLVSFGGVAASGGYYLACGDKKNPSLIYAPSTCVTGSIGVITGKLIIKGLKDKLGLKTFLIKQGKYSHLWSANNPFSSQGKELIKKSLLAYYKDFVTKVAAGRKKSYQKIQKIAQGRVWAGSDALRLGLIDGNLTLLEVIQLIEKKAGLRFGKYHTIELPIIRKSFISSITGVNNWSPSRLLELNNLDTVFLTGRPLVMLPYRAYYH